MRFFAFGAIALCIPVMTASAQPTPDVTKISDKIEDALKKSGAPSVSVAVVADGKLLFAKAYGSADREKGRAADAQTRYAVGSISKQFTAAALLLLQEEGKLS